MNDYEPPTEPAAEVAVLGAILRAGELSADIESLLQAEDFSDPARSAIYSAILRLSRNGKPCDVAATIAELDATAKRMTRNGLLLVELMEFAPIGLDAQHHAQVVADTAERARYLNAGIRVMQLARNGSGDAELGDLIRQTIDAVPRGGLHAQASAWDVLGEILDPKAEPPGIKLGSYDLDSYINPLKPGSITAIGARSGVGKTTLALDWCRDAAYRQGKIVLFISIEMTAREVYTKILSAEAGVDHTKLMMGHTLTVDEERKVSAAAARIGNGTLMVADVDSLTLADFRKLVREYKPDLTAVDFVGLCTFGKADRHDLAISDFVYGVKRVSAEENTHTLLLSQFNRSSSNRADKRPVMDDFKDSAALEHAAHLAVMIHRPDMHDVEERPGEVDVIIGKQRNGQAGRAIALAAQLHFSRFADMAPQYQRDREAS